MSVLVKGVEILGASGVPMSAVPQRVGLLILGEAGIIGA